LSFNSHCGFNRTLKFLIVSYRQEFGAVNFAHFCQRLHNTRVFPRWIRCMRLWCACIHAGKTRTLPAMGKAGSVTMTTVLFSHIERM